jgi:hypothetical protein
MLKTENNSHPYKTRGRTLVFFFNFTFLDSRRGDKRF